MAKMNYTNEELKEAESAKPEWRDATKYIPGKERIQDKALIMFDTFGILIHKDVSKTDNSWYMSCSKLGLEDRCLFKTVMHAAQKHALQIAIGMIGDLSVDMGNMEEFLLNNGK